MESNYILLSIIFACIFITLSNSTSIIKTLPGFPSDLPFTLETGYVGVGENDDAQFFYYFVESQRDPLHDPLLLYLTGGPGTPALYPFLYQIGPLSINLERSSRGNITLELNPYSWTQAANVIFLDLPAGVGFSYATTLEASKSGDSILATHCYDFIKKWIVEHPRFSNNPLYISGISYMGILVPVVTLRAFNGNERGDQRLNIKGCLIVSPLTDKFSDFNARVEYAHRLALISDDIYESTKEACHGNYVYTDPKNDLCSNNLERVNECISGINLSNILEPLCDDANPTEACTDTRKIYLESWANSKDVQKALHIREGTIETWEQNNDMIHYDFKKNDTVYYSYDIFSSISYHKQLTTKNCQVLILGGDHDMTFPYVGTLGWIGSLGLSTKSPWNPWFANNQVAGYRTTFAKDEYSLNYATIKGAGHSTALYKPQETSVIVDEWLDSHINLSDS
ncbi:serine carboxypeptidase-like 16 [Rutidosis leptorrhynchoides]|uniref:serine carboxypeptidase-like 16 n=1 Tax=Rutidosis leptorrhynchoides TaxID=125765 RepID=UPI003A9A4149